MRLRNRCAVLVAAASLTTVPVFADQHGHPPTPHASAPKSSPKSTPAPVQHRAVTTATHGSPTTAKAHTSSMAHGKAATTKSVHGAKSTTTTSAKHTTAKSPTSTTTSSKTSTTSTATGATGTTTTGTTGTGTTTTATNPIAQKIASHPQLASKLRKMLPSGISLAAASNGFKNQGQFIAALHVSKNLDIPFRQLKMEMTGAHPSSLGQAIQKLRPEHSADDAGTQVVHAEQQASDDVAATTTATTASTTAKTHKTKARKG